MDNSDCSALIYIVTLCNVLSTFIGSLLNDTFFETRTIFLVSYYLKMCKHAYHLNPYVMLDVMTFIYCFYELLC